MPDKIKNKRIPYFGDFVVFDEIGRGGMGVVYDAQQSSLDRRVALKLLHSSFAATDAGVQRLRIEAEATARLDHPNIVPIYEIGEHEGQPYLAMQLVEGESLAGRIERLGSMLKEKDAAVLMAKIARAIHHAHQRGVLHRDLKPGNVLIDAGGEPHLIDFGLAKCVEQDSGMTQTGAFLGTPAYASPEQASGKTKSVTTESDVYSLGAILYALLTGRPPFAGESPVETIEQVKNAKPLRPSSVRSSLSTDLETICLKCLEKETQRRYSSALELAEDLERFLDGRPITARPVGAVERLWMWTRRNPVHAALWLTLSLAALGSIVGAFAWQNVRAKEAETRRNILQRQLLLEESQVTRLTPHVAGWSEQAWFPTCEAVKIPAAVKSNDVRDQAAAALPGLDAQRIRPFTNSGASSVLFDHAGRQLLMGSLGDSTRLWDGTTNALLALTNSQSSPVAFAKDNTPAQLLYDTNRHVFTLANVLNAEPLHEWIIPPPIVNRMKAGTLPKMPAISPDGAVVVAALEFSDGNEAVVEFWSDPPTILQEFTNTISSLALAADGRLAAAAESGGPLEVWSLESGKRIATFTTGRNEVLSLALKSVARTTAAQPRDQAGNSVWLLAAGDSGGNVTIYDVQSNYVLAHCRGGHYQVYAVAFSPDGAMLASGGHGPVKLWDVAAGRLLLDVPVGGSGEQLTSLDFTSDARRLAISMQGGTGPVHVSVWSLEYGRGIQSLHGLSGQISKVCFSADGLRMAALSHKWEVGVWDVASGHLLRVIEAPEGLSADNAAIALDSTGEQLAFSAWEQAGLWNVGSGNKLNAWSLPKGLVDFIAFTDRSHLLLFREETRDGKEAPTSEVDPREHPRVCRIRNLLNPDATKPVFEIPDFNLGVCNATIPSDGRYFIVEGIRADAASTNLLVKAFDSLTGKELWAIPSSRTNGSGFLIADGADKTVAFLTNNSSTAVLAEMASGVVVKKLPWWPCALHSETRVIVVPGRPLIHERGCSLFFDGAETPAVTLGIDQPAIYPAKFDSTGNLLAWGNTDGTVTVCNLKEIKERLARANLQW